MLIHDTDTVKPHVEKARHTHKHNNNHTQHTIQKSLFTFVVKRYE